MAFPTIQVKDANGVIVTISTLPLAGSQTSVNSLPVVVASDQNSIPMEGDAASGATNVGNPVQIGGRATSQEQTPVADGQRVSQVYDLVGKSITSPYANKENWLRGSGSSSGTGAVTLIGAQGAGKKLYVRSIQCFNMGAANSILTFNDTTNTGGGTIIGNPAGGGNNANCEPPLVVPANTALTVTPGTASTTQYITVQAYFGV